MRSARVVSLLVLVTFARSATAQQTTTSAPQAAVSAPQATALLQQALAALSGGRPISDVTLSGTVRRIAGSDDESGTVVVKALAGTGTRIDLTLTSGPRSEIRNIAGAPPIGSWSGPDGTSHSIPYHNLLTDEGLFPAFALANFAATQNATITYIGSETKNGTAVIHITASQQFSQPPADSAPLLQHLTQTEIFLDASTYLPVAFTFLIHPDNNALIDIPVEIDFSNYTAVNGSQAPFHVQKYINNSLALDLQFESVVLNSGLSATTFNVGAGL